jgi:hypothetical protein
MKFLVICFHDYLLILLYHLLGITAAYENIQAVYLLVSQPLLKKLLLILQANHVTQDSHRDELIQAGPHICR